MAISVEATKELIRKYIKGQCTTAELDQILGLLSRGADASAWEAVWQEDLASIDDHRSTDHLSESEVDRIYERLLNRLQQDATARSPTANPVRSKARWSARRFWFRATAAAGIFFVIGSVVWFALHPVDRMNETVRSVTTGLEIAPGGNRAVLTLPDGQSIVLNDDQRGIVIDEDAIRYEDGRSVLSLSSSATALNSGRPSRESFVAASTMLTLTTPRGGQYQITLPDGTNVWLNAASTLKYPSNFSDGERRVELEGEAYFEVASVAAPESGGLKAFYVNSPGQEVKVLGTAFNINTYDQLVKTSLLEGSVQVSTVDLVQVLAPGQQSSIHPGHGSFDVQTIDVKSVIAWKEGYFYFSGDLSGILDQLSRWYDVDVIYTKDEPEKIRIDGRVSRSMTLNKLLTYLEEATGNVTFDLESNAGERRIIVK